MWWIRLIPIPLVGINAITDIRKREILLFPVLAGIILGNGVKLLFLGQSVREMTLPLLPGGILLFVSVISKESIGLGDGLMVMLLGSWYSFFRVMSITSLGFFMAGVFGIILKIRRSAQRNLPLVPFLLLGQVILSVVD